MTRQMTVIRNDADPAIMGVDRPITCSCIQSRGNPNENEANFFHRRTCFGDEVVMRIGRIGDDIRMCCLHGRLFVRLSECKDCWRQQSVSSLSIHSLPSWRVDRQDRRRRHA
jgi:hypothetical protein